MSARPLTDLGQQMLGSLPSKLRGSRDYQAVMHAASREVALLDAAAESTRAQFNPNTADLMLNSWEQQLRLPVGGAGASTAQRQQRVVYRLQKLLGASEGVEWEQAITNLVGNGWSYLEHVPGSKLPPANTLAITLPFPPSGAAYADALREIRELTPAHLDIEFTSTAGFTLDESQLDLQEWGS